MKLILAKIILLPAIMLLLVVISCGKSGVAEFSKDPVVTCYLLPGQHVRVALGEKTPYDDNGETVYPDLNSLTVRIKTGGVFIELTPMGNGVFSDTSGMIDVQADSTYILDFDYYGETIGATTVIPAKPSGVTQSLTTLEMAQIDPDEFFPGEMPDPVIIGFDNEEESFYMVTIQSLDTTQPAIFADSVPEYSIISTMPVTDTIIRIEPMRIPYFGMNRIILYHINEEYSQFFMQPASTTQNYQDPPTNIENGLGIFTGINTDTLYLNVVLSKK